ncbi:hypothetical protein ACE38W_16210 [Chitinophaga sp. Hz27]|uniref:hypothetical protein n=1 Tax=Chitinophaga sp. Hz27 TaxID=3347169 RepID=UPI0035D5CAF8
MPFSWLAASADYEKTYIYTIEHGELINIDTLSDKRIWTYGPEVISTADNHQIIFFTNQEVKGYVDIYDDRITLFRYK